jgi:leucyl/phenylalanyl-tRNA---protein transferase
MLTVLNPADRNQQFPPGDQALTEPNGLLAVGGCLSPQRLIAAYRQGIFPWYGDGEPILWWSPDPRLVLRPAEFHRSRTLQRQLRRQPWTFSFDQAFDQVIRACAAPRSYASGTWLNADMQRAYGQMHRLGWAHAFEVWNGDELVGGIYGVAVGRAFFGESMFHRATNASKAALAYACACLQAWEYSLIDCQVHTPHLVSLGATEVSRHEFMESLRTLCPRAPGPAAWKSAPSDWF